MNRKQLRNWVSVLRRGGLELAVVAKKTGVPLSTVKRWCNPTYEDANRKKCRERPYRTEESRDVREAKERVRRQRIACRMYMEGVETLPELAKRFGVAESTIKRWLTRHTYDVKLQSWTK